MTSKEFDNAIERIMRHLGITSQVQLGEKLGVRQPTISDARRRASIPQSWLITLLRDHSLNPMWVLRGTGAKFLVPRDEAPPPPDADNLLKNVSASMLLRALARHMNRPDIRVMEGETV